MCNRLARVYGVRKRCLVRLGRVSYLLIFLGTILLYAGGELLVRNASHLAQTFGLSSLVIGLTVVAFGTSSPELATTLLSTLEGSPEVAVGNVVGSNIANIGLILGLTALVYPLQSARAFIRRELPFMIVVVGLLFPVFWDGAVTRYEGGGLLALLIVYLGYQFRLGATIDQGGCRPSSKPDDQWRRARNFRS